MKYFINTISYDHVLRGIEGGFTQANHGKPHALAKLTKSDWMIFYSPKTLYDGGEPLQSFSAIGQVTDDEPYQVTVSAEFAPWRRHMAFEECKMSPIRPLLGSLDFIKDKTHWGYPFRIGMFEVSERDFTLIRETMVL